MTKQELAALFRTYHAAKVAADKAKALSATIKNEIRTAGPEGVDAGGFHASVSHVAGAMRFDEKRFKVDHPDLWEQYRYQAPDSERLNFK